MEFILQKFILEREKKFLLYEKKLGNIIFKTL